MYSEQMQTPNKSLNPQMIEVNVKSTNQGDGKWEMQHINHIYGRNVKALMISIKQTRFWIEKNGHILLQHKQKHVLKGLKRSTEQNNWAWMAMPSWHVVRWRGAYFGNDIKSLYLVATKQRGEHWHRKNIPDVIFLRLKRKKTSKSDVRSFLNLLLNLNKCWKSSQLISAPLYSLLLL